MKKWHLALALGLARVLMCLVVVVTTVRPPPAVTVRCSKVALVGNNLSITTETKNNTGRRCSLFPPRLEMQDGGSWREVSNAFVASYAFIGAPLLEPYGSATDTAIIRRLPAGTRLRLVLQMHREGRGMEIFLLRVKAWVYGGPRPPGTLFSTPRNIFARAGDVISEEFVAP